MSRWIARATLAWLVVVMAYGLSLVNYNTHGRLIAHVAGHRASVLETLLWPIGTLAAVVALGFLVGVLLEAAFGAEDR